MMSPTAPLLRLLATSAFLALPACGAKTIVLDTTRDARHWSDRSFAKPCDESRKPAEGHSYTDDTGTGADTIPPTGTPCRACCDMGYDGGG